MKFDSSALPLLPTPQQLTQLDDLLLSANELHRLYSGVERHPRVQGSEKSLELFSTCREQLAQDISLLTLQLEKIMTTTRGKPETETGPVAVAAGRFSPFAGASEHSSEGVIPDVEPTDNSQSVFESVRKIFQTEDRFDEQLHTCLLAAQARKHLKLELQLKMIILSAAQRCRLLEDRFGFARSKTLLFQGLRRQTTRFLSRLNGEDRPDIDR
jgi:hypothetical protein